MAVKTPEARRLGTLRWSVVGAWPAVGFGILLFGAVAIADSGGEGPEHRGIHEGNRVAPWVFLAVALTWLLSFFPVLPITMRLRALWWCRITIYVTGAAWLVWVYLRPHL